MLSLSLFLSRSCSQFPLYGKNKLERRSIARPMSFEHTKLHNSHWEKSWKTETKQQFYFSFSILFLVGCEWVSVCVAIVALYPKTII